MPEERLDVSTGEKVRTYSIAEAGNLAARMMATSDCDLGIFAMGFMAGMALADKKFEKPMVDKDIPHENGMASIAQAMCLIEDDYLNSKRSCVSQEVDKGPAFLEAKHRNIEILTKLGREAIAGIDAYLKKTIDDRVKEYEKVMIENLKKEGEQ